MEMEDFEKEIEDLNECMLEGIVTPELTGDKEQDRVNVLEEIEKLKSTLRCEIHVDFHLTNGETIRTRNHCIECYYSETTYVRDVTYMTEGWLCVEYTTDDGINHQARIKPDAVCWIDYYDVPVDWEGNKELILKKLKLR